MSDIDKELQQMLSAREVKIPENLKFSPLGESLYKRLVRIIRGERLAVKFPDWVEAGVRSAIELASKENACAFPGDPADMNHGHLLIPSELEGTSINQQLDKANGIVFHTQECLDPQAFGLDPTKRNLLYRRDTNSATILDSNGRFSINPNDINPNMCGGEIFLFEVSKDNELNLFIPEGLKRLTNF